MKPDSRVLGIDDAPFSFSDPSVPIVGVVMRGGGYIDAVLKSSVTVDGTDSTERLIDMIGKSRYKEQPKAVFLDGAALGGFNVVDVEALHDAIDVPVVTVTRDEPDIAAMEKALKTRFPDWKERLEKLGTEGLEPFSTAHSPIHVRRVGIERAETEELLKLFTFQGVVPEPLRVAHLIATAMVEGESRGRA
ncbi:MAG: DUF99 family protein [Euryarchaeota archaeon]|nr:DUF99 family protein [Euryarchaeota archaeon]